MYMNLENMNMDTSIIRTLFHMVPRVSAIDRLHCIVHLDYLLVCMYASMSTGIDCLYNKARLGLLAIMFILYRARLITSASWCIFAL